MPKKRNDIDFEKALEELEELVVKMEKGNLSLEESLKYFERGVALTRTCQKALSEAEQKVQILLEKDGKQQLQDFGSDDNNE
ncbi:MAG: xseB [Gammaproteobacteria bacterium]|nr:xseB [Gammaproteobacteria bacterium]